MWFHGGAFTDGSGAGYDGSGFAAEGIVVVTVNYRLGALGFLADPALSNPVGNYGFLDQQAALRWVHDNIGAFGGDPQQVTIAGQSAGAISVCDHLISPESVSLFDAAIIESGPCQVQSTVSNAIKDSIAYAAKAGCADAAVRPSCLRALPVDRFPQEQVFQSIGLPIGPVTGQQDIPENPVDAFAAGNVRPVPVLIGSNANESTSIFADEYRGTPIPQGRDAYVMALREKYGGQAAAIENLYPLTNFGNNVLAALAAINTDNIFACPTQKMTQTLASSMPVYAYEFADPNAPTDSSHGAPLPIGASHGSELQYLFGTPDSQQSSLTPDQRQLAQQMVHRWAQFVKTRSPNGAGLSDWPSFSADKMHLVLAPSGDSLSGIFGDRHQCSLWNSPNGP